jgi:hypothetical protein
MSLSGITGSDCIGDSRAVINNNFTTLGQNVCTLSANAITLSATSTIQHTFTNATRLLASDVRDTSIDTRHLADDSVTTAKISAEAVTTDKIALSAVTADKINLVTSLSTNGYQIMPNGLIMQWGSTPNDIGGANTSHSINFPIPFPNQALNVIVGTYTSSTDVNGSQRMAQLVSYTNTGFVWFSDNLDDTGTEPIGIHYTALGY